MSGRPMVLGAVLATLVVGGPPASAEVVDKGHAWLAVMGHSVCNEIKATLVEDDVYEFVAVERAAVVIEDSAGRVVVRDRGSIFYTALFDTLGDGQPGGDLDRGDRPSPAREAVVLKDQATVGEADEPVAAPLPS